MERNFERDLNGMAAEREHNLEEYYAYMAVRVLDGCGAGPCDGEPCVITQHYRFLEIAFRKSVYDSKKNLMHRTHLSFDSSVVSETAPSSRSVTT